VTIVSSGLYKRRNATITGTAQSKFDDTNDEKALEKKK
jgi:hypothetical protein